MPRTFPKAFNVCALRTDMTVEEGVSWFQRVFQLNAAYRNQIRHDFLHVGLGFWIDVLGEERAAIYDWTVSRGHFSVDDADMMALGNDVSKRRLTPLYRAAQHASSIRTEVLSDMRKPQSGFAVRTGFRTREFREFSLATEAISPAEVREHWKLAKALDDRVRDLTGAPFYRVPDAVLGDLPVRSFAGISRAAQAICNRHRSAQNHAAETGLHEFMIQKAQAKGLYDLLISPE